MGSHPVHLALMHHNNSVRVFHTGDPLGNDKLGGAGDSLGKSLPYPGVRGRVHGAGGIVQDQHSRFFHQSPGNAEPLFLPAGHVSPPLLDKSLIPLGHFLYKFVRAGQFTGMPALLQGGLLIAPAQIVQDGAGKQHIVLQHHRHLVPEHFHVVILYVDASHQKLPLRHIVQTADQVHQTGLGASGAADDADGLPGLDVQMNVLQHRPFRVLLIPEGHMVKYNASILHFSHRLRRIRQIRLLLQHLADSFGASGGHRNHDENHGEHHQAHENVHAVGEHVHKLPGLQGVLYNQVGPHPADQKDTGVNGEIHHRPVPGHNPFRLAEYLVDIVAGSFKFPNLVLLPHIGLHHPDGGHVFLDALVEGVILGKCLGKMFHGPAYNQPQDTSQENHRHQVHAGQAGADHKGHEHGADQGGRSPHAHAQNHLVGILHICHIRGEPCHQTGSAEFVNIGKTECLDVLIHCLSQVPCKARRRPGAVPAPQNA